MPTHEGTGNRGRGCDQPCVRVCCTLLLTRAGAERNPERTRDAPLLLGAPLALRTTQYNVQRLRPTAAKKARIRRVWGHAAIFAWSDLILDRSHKLVGLQSPAACATRAGGDSDPNFENYDLFHAQSPDTGRGVHARSWRANRDVDVRR